MFSNWFSSQRIATRPSSARPNNSWRPTFERLEERTMLTTLTVDIADPTANDPGDNLYAQIQEAVDAASEGDLIKVHSGTYEPFVVYTDNLTIREARRSSNPVVDGDLNLGDENGVEIHAGGVTVKGLTVINASESSSFGLGNGFFVMGDNNVFLGNLSVHNEGHGFSVAISQNNRFHNNAALENGVDGFNIFASNNNILTGNEANGNTNDGYELFFSYGNHFRANIANENGRPSPGIGDSSSGFQIQSSNENLIEGNVAKNNTRSGFEIVASDGNLLRSNTATSNGNYGFTINTSSKNNIIAGNKSNLNMYSGFTLGGGSGNSFVHNTSIENGESGFRISNGGTIAPEEAGNELLYNRAIGNLEDGFRVVRSVNTTLKYNWAMRNQGNGFTVAFQSNNNTLTNNWSVANTGDGFQLGDTFIHLEISSNLLEQNSAILNGGNGFTIYSGSNYNTLKRNRAFGNAGYGILVDAVMDNLFEDNFCLFNGLGGSNQPDVC